MSRTREEHLAFCKRQALAYLDRGDIMNAITSMLSDLDKHEETALASENPLTMLGMLEIQKQDMTSARRFIEGFR